MGNDSSYLRIERFDETLELTAGRLDICSSALVSSAEAMGLSSDASGAVLAHLGPMWMSLSTADAIALGDALIRAAHFYRAHKAEALAQQVSA